MCVVSKISLFGRQSQPDLSGVYTTLRQVARGRVESKRELYTVLTVGVVEGGAGCAARKREAVKREEKRKEDEEEEEVGRWWREVWWVRERL